MRFVRIVSLLVVSIIFFTLATPSQVSVTTLGPPGMYTQDFSVLGTTNFALTDNTSIPGVYAFRGLGNATPNIFVADDGSGTNGEFKNYGSTGSPDRALGSLASPSTEFLYYGIRFQNDTGITITSVEVKYFGEQWRDASTSPQSLLFSYQQSAGNITSLTAGTFTAVPALNFTTPTNTGSGAIDGNAPANRVLINAGFAVTIPPGQEIMIRWQDVDEVGVDHGYSIDDVMVTFRSGTTAADAQISGRVVTQDGRGVANVRVMLTGGDLTQPIYALTNPFGYYTFRDIESGRVYAVSISSKRYRFADPTRVVDLSDSALGVDFIAEP
jgi:hypothetical protein